MESNLLFLLINMVVMHMIYRQGKTITRPKTKWKYESDKKHTNFVLSAPSK